MNRSLKISVLALALLIPATVALAYGKGFYSGKTRQGLTITFSATATKLTSLKYKAKYVCRQPDGSIGRPAPQRTSIGSLTLTNGKVNTTARTPSGDDIVKFTAKLVGNSAAGTLNERYTSKTGGSCHSGLVRWSARHRVIRR